MMGLVHLILSFYLLNVFDIHFPVKARLLLFKFNVINFIAGSSFLTLYYCDFFGTLASYQRLFVPPSGSIPPGEF